MPRDSTLLPEWSQQLLRAARAGRLFEPPANTSDGKGEKNEVKKNGDTEHGVCSSGQHCVTLKKWTRAPRHLEEPEQDYLAKRRKGLPSLRNGIAGSLGFGGVMRKTKMRKVDSEGNTNVWQVLVPEGQSVEGEITNEEESILAVAKTTTPGAVIEGIGAVNSDGLIVVNDGLISTPPRRRPPPPRRKPKKGPGRGRKKVIFKPGEGGAEVKPSLITSGLQDSAAVDSVSASNATQGRDKDVTMTDMPEVDDNDEEGEDEEDEGEIEEGEDDEDDREEGELSPSSPGPLEIQAPANGESQSRRESVTITEAYPKPKFHPLPAVPSSTSGLPPNPFSLEASGSFPQHSKHHKQQQQQVSGQTGSAALPSTLTETKSSRTQTTSRDKDVQELRPSISLVPQHLFGAAIPPAPKPQHSSSLSTKTIKSPSISDTLTESRFAYVAISNGVNPKEVANKSSVPSLGNIESQDPGMLSSSPDVPLVEAFSHSRKNSQNIDFPSSQQEDSDGQVDEIQQVQEKGKEVEMADKTSIAQLHIQKNVSELQEQTPEPTKAVRSETSVNLENLAAKPKVVLQSNPPSISSPELDASEATTELALTERKLKMNEGQHQTSSTNPENKTKDKTKVAILDRDVNNLQAPSSSSSSPLLISDDKLSTTKISPEPEHHKPSSTSPAEATTGSAIQRTDREVEYKSAREQRNEKETVQKSPRPQEDEQQKEEQVKPVPEDKKSLKQDQNQNQNQAHDQETAHVSGIAGTTGTVVDTVATNEKSAAGDVNTVVVTDLSATGSGDKDVGTDRGGGDGDGSGDIDLLRTLERRLDAKKAEE